MQIQTSELKHRESNKRQKKESQNTSEDAHEESEKLKFQGKSNDTQTSKYKNTDDDASSNESSGDDDRSKNKFKAEPSFFRNKDLKNILFLMFLYLLQGVPLGLTGSLPFIMSSRNVSYKDQGTFSFAFWPFSMKLLWAPIVDTLYVKRFGRRKSWLVPMQYLIGLFLILFSNYVHQLLEGPSVPITHFDSSEANGQAQPAPTTAGQPISNAATTSDIYMLTFIFFMFTFMAATQDIAVDGWGLTILSK